MQCVKIFFLRLLLTTLLVCGSFPTFADQDITLLTLDNFPPYTWVENGEAKGIDVEIIEELRRRTGLPLLVKFVPWKRGVNMLKKGEAVGAFAAFRLSTRDEYSYYVEPPLHYSTYKVFVRKGEEFSFSSIYDLHGKIIAKNRGVNISEGFSSAVANGDIQLIEANNMDKGLDLLLRGRVDAVIGNVQEVLYFAKRKGILKDISELSRPMQNPRAAYLIISDYAEIKNRNSFIKIIENTLEQMRSEGVLDGIYRNYIP